MAEKEISKNTLFIWDWVSQNPDKSYGAFKAGTGRTDITKSSYYSALYRYRMKNIKKNKTPIEKTEPIKNIWAEENNRLKSEIEFLTWWNFGERQGFVDRLLSAISKQEN